MLKNRMLLGTKKYLTLCLEDIKLYQQGKIRIWFIKGSSYYGDMGWDVLELSDDGWMKCFTYVYLDELELSDHFIFRNAAIKDEVKIRISDKWYYFRGCKDDIFDGPIPEEEFNPDKHITPETLPLITQQVENFKQCIIEILDKYADNQEGDMNLKLLWFCNVAINKYKSNNLSKAQLLNILNPNFLGNDNLVSIINEQNRKKYLEFYSTKDCEQLIILLEVIFNQNKSRVEQMIFNSFDAYLIVFEIALSRLKQGEITLWSFVKMVELTNYEFNTQVTQNTKYNLEGYYLNLELDAEAQHQRQFFDLNRWEFIYNWIEQLKKTVVDDAVSQLQIVSDKP